MPSAMHLMNELNKVERLLQISDQSGLPTNVYLVVGQD